MLHKKLKVNTYISFFLLPKWIKTYFKYILKTRDGNRVPADSAYRPIVEEIMVYQFRFLTDIKPDISKKNYTSSDLAHRIITLISKNVKHIGVWTQYSMYTNCHLSIFNFNNFVITYQLSFELDTFYS